MILLFARAWMEVIIRDPEGDYALEFRSGSSTPPIDVVINGLLAWAAGSSEGHISCNSNVFFLAQQDKRFPDLFICNKVQSDEPSVQP